MFTSTSSLFSSLSCAETVTSISLLCILFIIINFNRLTNAMNCLITMVLVSLGLIWGLCSYEADEVQNFICCWAIFGAIAQFTFAGAVLMGFSGFYGCIFTLVLGFILCPIIWLRVVINVMLISFGSLSKRSGISFLIGIASFFGFTYAPISVDITNSITNIINRAGDTNYYTNIHNNYYLQYLENIINKNKSNRQPIAYAITVKGYGEQTLTAGASYTAAQLSPCCGSLPSPSGSDKVVFSVAPGSDADSCVLRKGDAGFDLKSSAGSSSDGIKATPGSTIILLDGAGNAVCRLYVDSVLYLDAEGRSCSRSASMINQALTPFRRVKY